MSLPSPTSASATPQSLRAVLAALEHALGRGPEAPVRVLGAEGTLGPALAAQAATLAGGAPVVYLVAEESQAEARVGDVAFFSPEPPGGDDPLASAAAALLPELGSSPYAEMQPDRRTIMRRMAALYRLGHGLAPRVLVASAAGLFRRVFPRAPFDELC